MTSQAFDTQACELVSTLFSLYMAGGVFSIVRDLILRVFYVIGIFYSFALFVPESLHEFIGDGDRPLRISFLAVSVNLFLDWFFTFFLSCGAQGMTIFFFFLLSPVLVLLHLTDPFLGIVISTVITTCLTSLILARELIKKVSETR